MTRVDAAAPPVAAGTDAPTTRLAGWGRCPVVEARELASEDLERATRDVVLTRGLGRSYGDASLPPPGRAAVSSRLADRILAFDDATGVLRAEAGLSLYAMNRIFLRRGWFTPVTPGTQFVTLGGMVAADVHGKNHHVAGTFGRHVRLLRMRVGTGDVLEITPDVEPELFDATLGGMGLTGHVLEVEVALERVPSPWIWCESETVPDLETMLAALDEAGRTWPYTVCWGDFVNLGGRGRGIVIKGRWATPDETGGRALAWPGEVTVPVELPSWALNVAGVRAFNVAYYRKHGRRVRSFLAHPHQFFYPLDAVLEWNRLYGRYGFTQYQCVLPKEAGVEAGRRLFRIAAEHGARPYLVVVKDCGPEGRGTLSFPRLGTSYAIDVPVVPGVTARAVDALDRWVIECGGRVYLAKDAFTSAEHYRAMDPRVPAFEAVRDRWDPERRLRSALSVRLFGDRP